LYKKMPRILSIRGEGEKENHLSANIEKTLADFIEP